jgi:hypothetical protein
MKYKIGDKVRVRSWKDMEKEFGIDEFTGSILVPHSFTHTMKKYCGKIMTIKNVFYDFYLLKESDEPWCFSEAMLEDVTPSSSSSSSSSSSFLPATETVILYKKDNTVVALDKQSKKEGIAYCAPEDTFDFYTGALIALARLGGIVEPARRPEPKQTYYNGEIVCVDAVGPFTVGKVYKVKDGRFLDDDGEVHGRPYPYPTFNELNRHYISKFIELKR